MSARMAVRMGLCAAAGMAVTLAAGVGCRTKSRQMDAERVIADTGGYSLRIVVKRPKEQKFELYEVTRQGRAGFAGGAEAMEDKPPTFLIDLPADLAARFREELAQCPWIEAKPDDRGPQGVEPITAVTLGLPNGLDRKFTLHGPQPQADVFVRLLEPLVRKRHDPWLDRLPEATEPPKDKAVEAPNP